MHGLQLPIIGKVIRKPSQPKGRTCMKNVAVTLFDVLAGSPGSSEVPRNPLTRWDVSSIPANGIFLTKKLKN